MSTALELVGKEPSNLMDANYSLLNNQEFSDLIVKCGDKIWHAHRAILASRSPVLRDVLKGVRPPHLVGSLHFCAKDSNLAFKDSDPIAVEILLEYLYTLEPPYFGPSPDAENFEVERNTIWRRAKGAYLFGSRYMLDPLASAGYKALLQHAPKLLKRLNSMDAAMIQERMGVITELWTRYGAGAPELQRAVMKGMVRMAGTLAKSIDFQVLLQENPPFMLDYVSALSSKVGRKDRRAAEKREVDAMDYAVEISD